MLCLKFKNIFLFLLNNHHVHCKNISITQQYHSLSILSLQTIPRYRLKRHCIVSYYIAVTNNCPTVCLSSAKVSSTVWLGSRGWECRSLKNAALPWVRKKNQSSEQHEYHTYIYIYHYRMTGHKAAKNG